MMRHDCFWLLHTRCPQVATKQSRAAGSANNVDPYPGAHELVLITKGGACSQVVIKHFWGAQWPCVCCRRGQEPMMTPWSEWWWRAVRWTCSTSELSSGNCLPAPCFPWSRYRHTLTVAHIWWTCYYSPMNRLFISSIFLCVRLKGDTGGDYRKALLLLCGGDDA